MHPLLAAVIDLWKRAELRKRNVYLSMISNIVRIYIHTIVTLLLFSYFIPSKGLTRKYLNKTFDANISNNCWRGMFVHFTLFPLSIFIFHKCLILQYAKLRAITLPRMVPVRIFLRYSCHLLTRYVYIILLFISLYGGIYLLFSY